MQSRTTEFWLVAYFLSKYGELNEKGNMTPPLELMITKWNVAYRLFYEKLAEERTISSFEHSLKNARDSYDSHIETSNRKGWRDANRAPNALSAPAKKVLLQYDIVDRSVLWNEVSKYVTAEAKDYQEAFDELAVMEDSESYKPIISKTEAGKKAITSHRYERSPALRNAALKIHGLDCCICGFNFTKAYGAWGKGFCEVHHVILLSSNEGKSRLTNPSTDLVVVCANCHRMLHRKKGITLTIEELKNKLRKNYP